MNNGNNKVPVQMKKISINSDMNIHVLYVRTEILNEDYINHNFSSCTKALIDNKQYHIIIDMNEVTYINSYGLAFIFDVAHKCRKKHGDVKLVNVAQAIQNMMDELGFSKILMTEKDEDTAIKELIKNTSNVKTYD